MSIGSEPWGEVDGQPVQLYTLANGRGLTVRIATYGGIVQAVLVPDRTGSVRNVALGFGSLKEYVANMRGAAAGGSGAAYFGAIVGRYANRIAGAAFTLDGARYELDSGGGAGEPILHGGPGAYSDQVWRAEPVAVPQALALRLSYVDPDGHNGFPGTVSNEVTYTVSSDNALRIEYRATTDAPTVISLTNHTYLNLAGEGSGDVYGHRLAINAGVVQRVDESGIPVEFAAVDATPFDFQAMKPIGRDLRAARDGGGEQLAIARGYDHNWVLRGAGYRLAAVAWEPESGIALWTYTDQPGIQFYTANYLVGDLVGTSGRTYRQGDAFALETQRHPDAPNHQGEPGWPDVVLRPGRVLLSRTTYRFGVAGAEVVERVRF